MVVWPIAIALGVPDQCMLSGTAPAVKRAVWLNLAHQDISVPEVSIIENLQFDYPMVCITSNQRVLTSACSCRVVHFPLCMQLHPDLHLSLSPGSHDTASILVLQYCAEPLCWSLSQSSNTCRNPHYSKTDLQACSSFSGHHAH